MEVVVGVQGSNSVVLAEIHPNNEQRPGWMKAEDWWERG
jgi:hypothetical protein